MLARWCEVNVPEGVFSRFRGAGRTKKTDVGTAERIAAYMATTMPPIITLIITIMSRVAPDTIGFRITG
jgi:hypothetical protein